MIEPIKPGEKSNGVGDPAIIYLNEQLERQSWHSMHWEKEEVKVNYNAIIVPLDMYKIIQPAVEKFKAVGWDMFFKEAYDGRGPHACVYVSKKHFAE